METTSLGAEGDGTWSEGREKASTPTTSVQTTGEVRIIEGASIIDNISCLLIH